MKGAVMKVRLFKEYEPFDLKKIKGIKDQTEIYETMINDRFKEYAEKLNDNYFHLVFFPNKRIIYFLNRIRNFYTLEDIDAAVSKPLDPYNQHKNAFWIEEIYTHTKRVCSRFEIFQDNNEHLYGNGRYPELGRYLYTMSEDLIKTFKLLQEHLGKE